MISLFQDREAMDLDVIRAVRLWYMPAAAELAIDLKPEENEARLGVGISCTEEVQLTELLHILNSSTFYNYFDPK